MAITNFIPEIWSANLLQPLQKAEVFGSVVNHDYEGDISNVGDTVHITTLANVTVDDYKPHTDISIEALDDTQQSLLIDQSKYFGFEVDDVEKRQAANDVIAPATANAAYQLADAADKFLSTLMAAGADAGNKLPAVTSVDPAKLYDTIVDLGVKLDEANVPSEGRWVVVNPAQYGLLLKDTRFINASDAAHGTLLNGIVGEAAGFSVRKSNNIPTAEAVATIIAGSTIAATFAEQITSVEATRKEKGFADIVKGLHLYGAKVVRPKALATVDYSITA
ncbi:coat protein [Bifidobacterium crudilactis]|jgi:N4-gp56 family major capsid protein|uniref:phage major capsid protein n=1 Tax=Bifidobacterium crudilactis TaxID=327277 RepID=UPI002F3591C3